MSARDTFREAVFKRDNHKCVNCGQPAKDAHHIMERRLWEDGGYYLDNGASLCEPCHILAEQTVLTPEQLREKAGILKRHLSPQLYDDYEYDKWGNVVNANGSRLKGDLFYDESVQKILASAGILKLFIPYVKYPRTFHLPFSKGLINDDRSIGDCSQFEGKEVIVMTKLDGENTTGYWDGHVHARSLDSDNHESRTWVKNFLSAKLFELPENWRINGENMFAKHSIHYKNLSSYFYMFALWNAKNQCMSWMDTAEWSLMLGMDTPTVWYQGLWDEKKMREFGERVDAGAKDEQGNDVEGYVVRLASGFDYGQFRKSVSKFVREKHVQTNKHWLRQSIVRNELCQSTKQEKE